MITVGAFEAKAQIAELLDRVAAGETVLITRRGVAAALTGVPSCGARRYEPFGRPGGLMSPPDRIRRDRAKQLAEIRRFRARCSTGKADIQRLIDDGRA